MDFKVIGKGKCHGLLSICEELRPLDYYYLLLVSDHYYYYHGQYDIKIYNTKIISDFKT